MGVWWITEFVGHSSFHAHTVLTLSKHQFFNTCLAGNERLRGRLCSAISGPEFFVEIMGRWRSWLSHLSNTQKAPSSSLGRLTLFLIFLVHHIDCELRIQTYCTYFQLFITRKKECLSPSTTISSSLASLESRSRVDLDRGDNGRYKL